MAASDRVQHILSEVRKLSDEEKADLEELLLEEATSASAAATAWGEEIDRRAQRVVTGEAKGLDREQVRSLFAMSPKDARAQLAKLLNDGK